MKPIAVRLSHDNSTIEELGGPDDLHIELEQSLRCSSSSPVTKVIRVQKMDCSRFDFMSCPSCCIVSSRRSHVSRERQQCSLVPIQIQIGPNVGTL